MKLDFRPSDITCSDTEFFIAEKLVMSGISHEDVSGVKGGIRVVSRHLPVETNDYKADNIIKIMRIVKILFDELIQQESLDDVTNLRTPLIAALCRVDDFSYKGLGSYLAQKFELQNFSMKHMGELANYDGNVSDEVLMQEISDPRTMYEMTEKISWRGCTRIASIFNERNIRYIGDLLTTDVSRISGFGHEKISLIRAYLHHHGVLQYPLAEETMVILKERMTILMTAKS